MNFIQSAQAHEQFFVEVDDSRFRQFANDTITLQYIRATMMYVHGRRTTTETFVVPFEWSMKIRPLEAITKIFGDSNGYTLVPRESLISLPFPNGLPSDTAIEQFSS